MQPRGEAESLTKFIRGVQNRKLRTAAGAYKVDADQEPRGKETFAPPETMEGRIPHILRDSSEIFKIEESMILPSAREERRRERYNSTNR
jgi:hypothetical protein